MTVSATILAPVENLRSAFPDEAAGELDAIRDACPSYVTSPLRAAVAQMAGDVTDGDARVEVDADDPDSQTLLFWFRRSIRMGAPMSASGAYRVWGQVRA